MFQQLPRRSHLPFMWAAFALVALATGLAVYRLYATVRREIADQSERALHQESAKARERAHAYTDEARRTTIEALVSFHVDGLDHALRQWNEANAVIKGTFQWEPQRGFVAGFVVPQGGPPPEELARLWQQLREWRTKHPGATNREPLDIESLHTLVYRTSENPALPASELGYQSENLDMLTYAGRPVDPWAGWAASSKNPTAPWVFWYQEGPDEGVRGCFIDVGPIARQLRGEFKDTTYARVELAAAGSPSTGTEEGRLIVPLDCLPAYVLTVSQGDAFLAKAGNARLTAVIIALLFGIFLVGAALLTLHTRREAREAERQITFVARVSHELRTPLTSIRMFADMLAGPDLPDEKRAKFANTISRESQRLGALIERLLAFNALGKNGSKIACKPVDVTAVVQEVIEEMGSILRGADLTPEVDPPAIPAVAVSDLSILKGALVNLLDNAVKYARDGGVVRIEIKPDRETVLIRVSDRGPGVPKAIRNRLFEPFVQGGQTLTNKDPGVGLGLSIARGMLRQIGADLVLADSDSGATFEIRLPRGDLKAV